MRVPSLLRFRYVGHQWRALLGSGGAWRPRLITCCQRCRRLTPDDCPLPSGSRDPAVIYGNAFRPSLTAYVRRLVTDQQHHGIAKTAFRGPAKNVGGLPAPSARLERGKGPDRMQARQAPVGAHAAANPRPALLGAAVHEGHVALLHSGTRAQARCEGCSRLTAGGPDFSFREVSPPVGLRSWGQRCANRFGSR